MLLKRGVTYHLMNVLKFEHIFRRVMAKRRLAYITHVRNERTLLPHWYAHALKFVDPCDVYIMDHESSDSSIEQLKLNKENLIKITTREAFTNQWLTDQASDLQNKLLMSYDWVVFAEVDEFIFPDVTKCPGGFDELLFDLENKETKTIRCLGYDILHDIEKEQPIDLSSKPWLMQRSYARIWRPELNGGRMAFSKPVLSCEPLRWKAGGHDVLGFPDFKLDERLVLVHCHFLDIDLCEQRRKERRGTDKRKMPGDRLDIGQMMRDELRHKLNQHRQNIPEELKSQF